MCFAFPLPFRPKLFAAQDDTMRSNRLLRLLFVPIVSIVALIGIGVVTAAAQDRIPDRIPNRIDAEVSNARLAAIPGSVSPRVRLAADLGPVAPETILHGMSLRFTPSAAQQAALDQLLAGQQNPASPMYHQWLTPQQYAAQFGLSATDLAKVTAWLEGQGFTVTGVAQGGGFVTFDGTVAQAQTAFSTSIHSLSVNGEIHFANVTEASVPSAFAGVVGDVTGLHDFRMKPRVHTSVAQPNFTSSFTGNHFLAPGDLYTIYDMNPLLASYTGAGIGTASGKCLSVPTGTTCGDIAVIGQIDITLADVAAFRTASGLSANAPTIQVVPASYGGCDPGTPSSFSRACDGTYTPSTLDLKESSLDVEWSGAMAPSATILFVTSQNVFISMQYAIDANVAPIITASYGLCEAGVGSTALNSYNQLFKQANAQGQTILAAAGDTGATDCDPNTETSAIYGLAVDFPGDSPYVTAMGGTMFNGDAEATGTGSAWSATQYWKGTSGSDAISSALSYIPEAAWNDAPYGGFGGGGGGASAFFAKPAWQVETGASGMTTLVPPDAARDVPDLALTASGDHDAYILCVQGSCVNGFRAANNAGPVLGGGTSFVAPTFSGMLALVEQKLGSRLGNINPTLYALGNSTYYNTTGSLPTGGTSVFHDVTTGSNTMPCTAGSTDCPTGGSIGYSAGTGYDLATGWGSVDLNNLATDWTKVTPLGTGSLGSNLSATSLVASSTTSSATNVTVTPTATVTVTLTATVTGAAATPTGTVQFLANNIAAAGASKIALTPGVTGSATAAYAYVASCSTLGQQSMSAVYSGDANYQGSIGPALTINGSSTTTPLIVTVNSSTCPSFSLTSAGSVSVAAGGTIPGEAITVVPANGLTTGTVAFTAVTTSSSSGYIPTFSFSPASVTISSSASVATTLTLSGITASLRLPSAPGKLGSEVMLAQQSPGRTRPWTSAGSGVAFACLLLLILPRRRRLGGLLLLIALSVALVGGATGCGGSSQTVITTTPPTTNPYAGVYIVTVTGTYTGSVTLPPQTVTLTYSIQ
jgi:subtilase family serine protease